MPADVLVTHSYHLAHDAKQWRKMQPYPPLGTLYAASALIEAEISTAVFDPMFADPVSGFIAALKLHQPKIVVLYEDDFNFVTKMCLTHMRDLALHLAGIAHQRGIAVVAHGSDATDHPRVYLDHGVEYVLKGEAEHSLADLCALLLQQREPVSIPGLTFYADGMLQSSAPLPNNPAWATLPIPVRSLIDLAPYRQAWQRAHGLFSTNLVASRGCPYRCNWCAKPISGSRFQLRPVHAVADEVQQLKALGVEHLWFSDDVFALDRHWVEAFAEAIEARGVPLPFKIQSRADLMTETTVAALKRAGCTEVWMGVESGSQKILNAMSKSLSLVGVESARRNLAASDIKACFFLQFGYPGEGWSEIVETIELVRALQPDNIGVSLSYPLPGTEFYARVQQQLGDKRNWTDSDDLCTIHTAAYRDEFYHALRDALHAEVSAHGLLDKHCESLWSKVYALEPITRNLHVLELAEEQPHRAAFLTIAELTAATGGSLMPDLLLTHGYFLYEDPKEMQIMKPYAPLGILYLCSHLRKQGFAVEVFDTTFSSKEALFHHLRTETPTVLGIYANLMTRSNAVEIMSVAREAGWRVVVGGPEPGAYAQEYLEAGAEFVVFGEGEATLQELLTSLRDGAHRTDAAWRTKIAGVAYLDELGRFHQNPPRTQIADLDAQPWPARHAIDLHRYVDTWRTHHQQGSVNFITARGCPYKCRWCSHQVYGQTHRRRNPIKVVDEVEWLLETYTPDIAWVSDDVFTINHEWLRQYAGEMRRRGLRIPFECISRADRLNEEMLDLLAELGCFRVWIGSESGSQRLLDSMDRGVKVEQVQRAIEMSRARSIQSGMFLMWGYEGEEMEDIEATIQHVSRSKPDVFFTTVSYPIKGTPYYQQIQSKLVQLKPWGQSSDREIKVLGRHSRAYYAHADKLLRDEVQRAVLVDKGAYDHATLNELNARIVASRQGLAATRHEVEA